MVDDTRNRPGAGRLTIELLHLAGLSALALAQPTYALIAGDPQFLAAHGAGRWQILLIVATLSLLPPLVAAGFEILALAAGSSARAAVHSILIGLFAALLAVQALTRLWPSAGGPAAIACAAAAGIAFAVLYRRVESIRTFVTFLSLSAVVVPAVFLLDERTHPFLSEPADAALHDVRAGNPVPLVLVVFDELPLTALVGLDRVEIETALFPSFGRLAAMSHWFRNATTTSAFTELAIPSLHTGRYSEGDRLPTADLRTYPNNLFTLLGSTYDVQALETTTNLQPSSLAQKRRAARNRGNRDPLLLLADLGAVSLNVTTPAPWNARLPRIDARWAGFWEPRVGGGGAAGPRHRVAELRDFIADIERTSRPPFVYVHPLFPHWPWEYLPSGRRYYDGALDLPGHDAGWLEDEWPVLQGYQRLRIQIAAADRILGALLDRLELSGWLDEALLVVIADHGSAFTPGAPRRELQPEHEEILRRDMMPIPLFIKLPGQREPFVHDDKAEIIDVLPTIADVLDLEVPWPVHGRSLFDPASSERPGRRVSLRKPFVTLRMDDRPSPVAEVARQRNSWFGRTPAGAPDLFRFGPDAHRVGEAVDDDAVTSSSHRVVLRNEHLFRGIEPDDSRLPAFVQGEIEPGEGPPLSPGAPLAVAVNGVVRATTRIHAGAEGVLSFAALLPEEALAVGDNAIEVFLLGPGSALVELGTRGTRETLRAAWASAPRRLYAADASTGWEGFRGAFDTTARTDEDGALVVETQGAALRLDLPRFDAGGAGGLLVAIELESEAEITPILYYMTAQEPVFRLGRFVISRARAGRGIAFFEVKDPDLVGALSIDLGRRGRVRVHSLDVRAAAP